MPVYKCSDGTWRVVYRIKIWPDKIKQTTKRGFKTKREAVEFEKANDLTDSINLDMPLADFIKLYKLDVEFQIRESTMHTKDSIFQEKIIPYLGNMPVSAITNRDILQWENKMKTLHSANGKLYSQTYLKTVYNQLVALLNHAVKYYGLKENPANHAPTLGSRKGKEMQIWTTEEYKQFRDAIEDKPLSFYAFEILYWCGLRVGELLALTRTDINLTKSTISITKSLQHLKKRVIITPPKTAKGNRIIAIPNFLRDELKDFLQMQALLKDDEPLFPITKHYLRYEIQRGCEASGVKQIRVHDLRHSHVSLLIDMGFSAVAIGDRVGHESASITYHYAHLFPTVQKDMANQLNTLNTDEEEDDDFDV